MSQGPETIDVTRALAALEWAASGGVESAGAVPARPTPPEWRALDLAVLRSGLDRALLARVPETGLDALYELGLLDAWLPEVAALVGFGDGEWRHKDIWRHTKQVVAQSVPRLEVRWAALLHDIGKPKTRSIEPDGEVHFFGHAELGAAMFRKSVAKRLGLTGELHERVDTLILHHLRASHYDGSWTDSAVRRFAREIGAALEDLLDLSRADITTKRPERRREGLAQIAELSGRIAELAADDAKAPPLPKGLGTALGERFAIPPSKLIGDIRAALEDAVEAGELEPGRDAEYYVAWVDAQRARFGL